MKKIVLNVIVLLMTVVSFSASAQYQNNQMGSGLDRTMGTDGRYNAPRSKEKTDYTKLMVTNLTKQLSLDSFQNAILTKIFEEYNQKIGILSAENIPVEAKSEKFKIAQTALDVRIIEILTDKQKETFTEMKDAKKNKKNKKKKGSDSDETEHEMF